METKVCINYLFVNPNEKKFHHKEKHDYSSCHMHPKSFSSTKCIHLKPKSVKSHSNDFNFSIMHDACSNLKNKVVAISISYTNGNPSHHPNIDSGTLSKIKHKHVKKNSGCFVC